MGNECWSAVAKWSYFSHYIYCGVPFKEEEEEKSKTKEKVPFSFQQTDSLLQVRQGPEGLFIVLTRQSRDSLVVFGTDGLLCCYRLLALSLHASTQFFSPFFEKKKKKDSKHHLHVVDTARG